MRPAIDFGAPAGSEPSRQALTAASIEKRAYFRVARPPPAQPAVFVSNETLERILS
jgi:hypothetical protein